MKRTAYLAALLVATVLMARDMPRPDKSRALPPIPTFRSAIAIASTPLSSSPTPSRSPIPSTTSCSA